MVLIYQRKSHANLFLNQKIITLLIKKKACFPNFGQKLKLDFNLSNEVLKKACLLPHSVAFEPYVKAFQFKGLNSILFHQFKVVQDWVQDRFVLFL